MEFKDSNILIDKFLTGRELSPSGKLMGRKRGFPVEYENWYDTIEVENLKYHTSWDWLMLVVEKIKLIRLKENNVFEIDTLKLGTPIATAYEAIINFINYHNAN